MPKLFERIKIFLLDILFPIQCLGCGKEGQWICDECLEAIKLTDYLVCPICKKNSVSGKVCWLCQDKTALAGLLVACSYKNEFLKKAIHIFKYKFVQDLSKPLAVFLIQRLETVFGSEFFPAFWKDEVYSSEFLIIPVPLHQKRLRWRGFNQAELLGKRVSSFLKLPFKGDVLIRRRYTIPQTEIKNKEKRKENIKGAFQCIVPEKVKAKRIILVDDVCTTASTLNECAKALSKSGAKEIWGLVLARG